MRHAKLGEVRVGGGNPVAIVGAINVGPESFYGGSVVRGKAEAVKRASAMLEEGARIIDVGAMSTAPGAKPISTSLEMRRLIPVVKALAKELDAPISVDTQRAAVAEAALAAGAKIVNDVSGLKADPKMARVISSFGCSTVLMAANERPGDAKSIGEIINALRGSLRICELSGIDERKVVVDPGIGFGKGAEWDLHILANLGKLRILGRPICVAVSRKSFIGSVLGLPDPADRLWGSLAAAAIAVLEGADVVRTHDPKETSHAVRIAEAIRSAGAKVKRSGGERGSAR
jgi:dihydropteroate synthase